MWQRHLRRSIGWTLLLKLVALIALWALFFSPGHRMDVTPAHVDAQLVVGAAPEEPHD